MKNKNIGFNQSSGNSSEQINPVKLLELILKKGSLDQYLEINTVLKIIDLLPAQTKNSLLRQLRNTSSSSSNISEKILSFRLLSRLEPTDTNKLLLTAIKQEKAVFELINILMDSLPEVTAEKGLYKHADLAEEDVYQHTISVAASLQFIISLFSSSVYARQIDQDIAEFLLKEFKEIKPAVKEKISVKMAQEIDGFSKSKLLIMAAFLHDSGKPITATPKFLAAGHDETTENNGFRLAFPDHEKAGAELVPLIGRRLGLTEKQLTYIKNIIYYHRDIKKAVKYSYQYDYPQAKKIQDTQLRILKQLHANFDIHFEVALLFLADNLGKHFLDEDKQTLIKYLQAFIRLVNF